MFDINSNSLDTISKGVEKETDCNDIESKVGSGESVHCPELGDKATFKKFKNIDKNTQCWSKNTPSFTLYMGTTYKTIANEVDHLMSLSPDL